MMRAATILLLIDCCSAAASSSRLRHAAKPPMDDATLRLLKKASEEEGGFNGENAPRRTFAGLQMGGKRQPDAENESIDEDDEFEYGDAESHAREADPSDYSVHQFIAGDDARGVKAMNDDGDADGDDGAQAEVDKSEAEAGDDDFDSEETPDDDSFLAVKSTVKKFKRKLDQDVEEQSIDEDDDFEYGDAASHDRLADPSDYSEHQFIAGDDARGVKAMTDAGDSDGDDGAQAEVDKYQAEAQDSVFDAEDTPEDSFMQLKSKAKKFKAGKKLDQDVEDQSID